MTLASDSQLAPYVAGWQERAAARAIEAAKLRARLEERLPAVVQCLTREFGATSVLLFGSLARGDAGRTSDVDLLVEGIPLERLLEAATAATHLLREAEADVVPRLQARPEVVRRALTEGRVLHG